VASLQGTTDETEARSNKNDNDNDNDNTFQKQRQGALKLPATKPKNSTLNTCSQDHAATQLPWSDANGHLFTTFGKGTASVATRKMINNVDAWFPRSISFRMRP
jgi:hypothetical protein